MSRIQLGGHGEGEVIGYTDKPVVVLGATGYVGGRLVPALLAKGCRVRATGRSLQKLQSRVWADNARVDLCAVDVHDPDSLRDALAGAGTVFYLIHSMNPHSRDFEAADRTAADNMVRISAESGVQRIIYLGGLGEARHKLSKHLRSRNEVSDILKSGPVPVTVLRAAMIIGSGSASFEILRYLIDRLPVMVTPQWVRTPNQPIAIRNVIGYLSGCLDQSATIGRTFDIGGPEVVTYQDLMDTYAEVASLRKRFVIPVPVLTPRLSSLWIHLVTPVPSYIAMPLTEGLTNEVVCQDDSIRRIIPQELLTCREAMRRALDLSRADEIQTHWADAGVMPKFALTQPGDPKWAGGTLLLDERVRTVDVPAAALWEVIRSIGGRTGWYHATWLWVLRGWLDRLWGGVGLRRGRRHPTEIAPGDALDFWRVIKVLPSRHLLLEAEMKLPGRATLEFILDPQSDSRVVITQRACFKPKGLGGIIYWYALVPFHHYIFGGMMDEIIRRARAVRLKLTPRQSGKVL